MHKKWKNTRLRVKYSYYTILILDTGQPIVNSTKAIESYGRRWKVVEATTSFYIILDWSGMSIML